MQSENAANISRQCRGRFGGAFDPGGINQVGCVYTAQGFEFDYVGVIFGKDLVFDVGRRGNRKISHDSVVKKAPEDEFVNLVKQTYRVLLTRGMKGCYVYFEDTATREFFLSRMSAVIDHSQSAHCTVTKQSARNLKTN